MSFLVTDIETTPTSGIGKIPEPTQEKPDPFPPTSCHVPVVIGCLFFDDKWTCTDSRVLSQRSRDEATMLELFVRDAESNDIVTWNGRSFDIPVIVLRCLRYGIQMPWYYHGKFGPRYRYNDGSHRDVMEDISNFGATKNLSLNDVAQVIGLPGKMDVAGAKVQELWEGGRQVDVENYCMTDVVQTAFIWLRHEYMKGQMTLDHYRAVTAALIKKCQTNTTRYGELLDKTDMKVLLLGGDDAGTIDTVDRGGDEDAPKGGGDVEAVPADPGPDAGGPEGDHAGDEHQLATFDQKWASKIITAMSSARWRRT